MEMIDEEKWIDFVTPPQYIQAAIDKLRPVADGEHCIVCGSELSGRRRTFCSDECWRKNFEKYNWSEIRKRIIERDGYKCAQCGSKWKLQVHHIKPVDEFPELVIEESNLITLCTKCHIRKEAYRKNLNEKIPQTKIVQYIAINGS